VEEGCRRSSRSVITSVGRAARGFGALGISLVFIPRSWRACAPAPSIPYLRVRRPLPKDPTAQFGVDQATSGSEVFDVTTSILSMIHARMRARAAPTDYLLGPASMPTLRTFRPDRRAPALLVATCSGEQVRSPAAGRSPHLS
jgi:hypothetical protein